jgi:hypothetical protein
MFARLCTRCTSSQRSLPVNSYGTVIFKDISRQKDDIVNLLFVIRSNMKTTTRSPVWRIDEYLICRFDIIDEFEIGKLF